MLGLHLAMMTSAITDRCCTSYRECEQPDNSAAAQEASLRAALCVCRLGRVGLTCFYRWFRLGDQGNEQGEFVAIPDSHLDSRTTKARTNYCSHWRKSTKAQSRLMILMVGKLGWLYGADTYGRFASYRPPGNDAHYPFRTGRHSSRIIQSNEQ